MLTGRRGRVSGFAVLEYGARPTAVVRATVTAADLPGLFARALQAVLVAMEAQGTLPAGEPFAYYHNLPDEPVDVEVGFPMLGAFVAAGEVVPGELPGVGLSPVYTWVRTRSWHVR